MRTALIAIALCLVTTVAQAQFKVGQVVKSDYFWKIMQKLEEDKAHCKIMTATEGAGVVGNEVIRASSTDHSKIYAEGFPSLKNKVDGNIFSPGIFKVTGTYEYRTRSGKRTVLKAEPATREELDAYTKKGKQDAIDALEAKIKDHDESGKPVAKATRERLRLMKTELAKESPKKNGASQLPMMREWKTADYKYKVEAKYVGYNKSMVELITKDGKKVSVPIHKLRPKDQQYVRAYVKQTNKAMK